MLARLSCACEKCLIFDSVIAVTRVCDTILGVMSAVSTPVRVHFTLHLSIIEGKRETVRKEWLIIPPKPVPVSHNQSSRFRTASW